MKNNGVTDHIDQPPMFGAPALTVPYNGNGVAYAFVQTAPFCASDDVQILVPKQEVPLAALLFVAAVVRRERYRYSYGRKWHLARMRDSSIRLPATNDGDPDWELMAEVIAGTAFSAGAIGNVGQIAASQ